MSIDSAALSLPMESIGSRIKQARERLGLSQEAFAKPLGVTRGAVGNWERDQGIKRENLVQIAERYGLTVDWLASGSGSPPAVREPSNATPSRRKPVDPDLGPEWIPAYGQAMGGEDGYFILNGNKIADLLAPPSLVGVQDAYAVYVAGDSMEPRYYAGEALFVNPRVPIRRGDFVVAQVQFEREDTPRAYVKRFQRMNDVELVLEQFNPAKELRFDSRAVVSVHRITLGGDA